MDEAEMASRDKNFERFKKWGSDYASREGIDPQEIDFQAEYDSSIGLDENYSEFSKRHHVVKHQYGSENYAKDQQRKADEAWAQEEKDYVTTSKVKVEEGPVQRKEFRGNVNVPKSQADVTEMVPPEQPSAIQKSLLGGISGWIGEKKSEYEAGQERHLHEREYAARKNIAARSERLNVNAMERAEQALKKREFEESPIGKFITGIKGRHAEQGGYGYRANYAGHVEPATPIQAALHSKEAPLWLQGRTETPGWMGGGAMRGAPQQRSALMDAAMGRTGYQGGYGSQGGYPGYRQPRRKVIVVNGRTYVVQHEPTNMRGGGYTAPVEPPTMLQQAMFSPQAAQPQYTPRHAREQPSVSPFAQAVFGGGGEQSHSPLMSAMMSGHVVGAGPAISSGHSHRKESESQSPLQKAMSSGGKGGFKL